MRALPTLRIFTCYRFEDSFKRLEKCRPKITLKCNLKLALLAVMAGYNSGLNFMHTIKMYYDIFNTVKFTAKLC